MNERNWVEPLRAGPWTITPPAMRGLSAGVARRRNDLPGGGVSENTFDQGDRALRATASTTKAKELSV